MNVCGQCGEEFITPKMIDHPYSVETNADGSKIIKTERQQVSPCCKEIDFETFD